MLSCVRRSCDTVVLFTQVTGVYDILLSLGKAVVLSMQVTGMYTKVFSLGKVLGLMALVFWLVVGVTATVPPPSKEGKSPSNLVLFVRLFLSMQTGQELW